MTRLGWRVVFFVICLCYVDNTTAFPRAGFGRPVQQSMTVILSAMDIESSPFIQALDNQTERMKVNSFFCQSVQQGTIYNQSVLIVTGGMGSSNITACLFEVLLKYQDVTTEVIFAGTAGCSPSVGGLVTEYGTLRAIVSPTFIGDLCISSLARSYSSHFSSVSDWKKNGSEWNNGAGWANQYTQDELLQYQFEIIEDVSLTEELLEATNNEQLPEWPKLPDVVFSYILNYFNYSGVSISETRTPKAFGPQQCLEGTSLDYWSGVPEEILLRTYVASTILKAFGNTTQPRPSLESVLGFSAMEGVPWMGMIKKWNQAYGTKIRLANIRSASDYAHPPLAKNLTDGKYYPIMTSYEFVFDSDPNFDLLAFNYSSNTAAIPVLRWLKQRSGLFKSKTD